MTELTAAEVTFSETGRPDGLMRCTHIASGIYLDFSKALDSPEQVLTDLGKAVELQAVGACLPVKTEVVEQAPIEAPAVEAEAATDVPAIEASEPA